MVPCKCISVSGVDHLLGHLAIAVACPCVGWLVLHATGADGGLSNLGGSFEQQGRGVVVIVHRS